jgi:hypothetical protein
MNNFLVQDAHHLVDDAATRLSALEAVLEEGDLIEAHHYLGSAQRLLETALKRMERATT